jgi:hypothetical protein
MQLTGHITPVRQIKLSFSTPAICANAKLFGQIEVHAQQDCNHTLIYEKYIITISILSTKHWACSFQLLIE